MPSQLRHRNTYPGALAAHPPPPLHLDDKAPGASRLWARRASWLKAALRTERGMRAALWITSLCTRFAYLSYPPNVVFDEVHFGGFAEQLLARRFPFDIHPWLGKLTLTLFAYLAGYRAQAPGTYKVTQPYTNADYYWMRVPSALFGAAIPPLMYSVAREFGLRPAVALATATLPLLDNLLIMESRFILLDSQLMFYLHLALLLALRLFKAAEMRRLCVAADRPSRAKFYKLLCGTALACACAMGVKWTAGVTPLLIALTSFLGIWHLSAPLSAKHCAVAAILGLAAYLAPWVAFLRIATHSTESCTRLSDSFRATLQGNATLPYNPQHNRTVLSRIFELHATQFRANKKIKTRHTYESKWYEWPLNLRGIFYLALRAPGATEERPNMYALYLIQNPAACLAVFLSVAFLAASAPLYWRYRDSLSPKSSVHSLYHSASFLLAGYFLNLLPYIFVERCYFLYHYMPALMYGQLAFGLLLEHMPRRVAVVTGTLVAAAVVACFVYFAPWIYALTIHYKRFLRMRWLPRWD